MKGIIICFTLIGLFSCGEPSKDAILLEAPVEENVKKTDNAIAFINGYVENVNKMNKSVGLVEWVNSNKLSTDGFKKELERIIKEAYKNEPDFGLDADPLFDAQDNPEKGFTLESFDAKSNYLTLVGVDWDDFKLTMKIKKEHGIWLVDGCGMINIPQEKRATR